MKRMPEELINDIRSKTDIVDTISRYMTLSKKGKNYWGVCPFHDDNNPSMSVSPDRQIYKCFVCGAGGNVFSFVKDFEKIGFIDAVVKTASFIDIDVTEYEPQNTVPVDEEKLKLFQALDETQKFTEFQLYTKTGKDALSKLEARGYSMELIKKFGIGVAFGDNQLSKYLIAKGFNEKELVDADLVRVTDRGIEDVFYQRIMFPIYDRHGRVIAFSARALSDENKVKYINTSETRLYTKGLTVYNLHNAKEAARKHDFILVAEGVTDTIAFTKSGYDNTVSLLGVACTNEQIQMLKQCSSNVVLAFDGDRAGLEATYQVGMKLRKAHCSVTVWYNDTGLDPDECIREYGIERVQKGVDDRINWLDFLMSYGIGNYGLDSFDNRKRVVQFMIDHLKNEDELEQSYYLKKLSDKTNFEYSVLSQQLNARSVMIERDTPLISNNVSNTMEFNVNIPERAILRQMLISKEAAYLYRDQLGFLVSDLATDFALIILDCYRNQEVIEIADILSLNISEKMKKFAIDIESSDLLDGYNRASMEQNINLIRNHLVVMGIHDMKGRVLQQDKIDDQAALLEEAIKQLRNKNKREGEH
ncbi:DNA primase [Erysipelothrix rhusiopathiae]|uniref:DNA primase n=1 Tax=Erysipelothrix rhusiopathiae TaxID=1648 RepID=UPI002953AB50|nr:DNA primase [Erysipelothrix rhusiopathiae]MDV7679972.1 DNA primase [Erysipelothrix rhusiopathiae]